MSDPIPSFITQVHNPNESQETHEPDPLIPQNGNFPENGENANGKKEKPPKSKSCFFCCFSGNEEPEDQPVAQPQPQKQTIGRLTINPGTHDVPESNDRYGINSPRMSGKHQPPGAAVYIDDHLLPPPRENKKGKKCLVLDLDETLVHSSFKLVPCDFVVPVKIDDKTYKVYVAKRPFADEFMKRCGELFEVVVFTASLAQYADPVVDLLDIHNAVDWRLFRESCTPFKGAYVKDMGRMGRDINQIVIVDNSPHSYLFNRENAFPCESWYNDQSDRELLDMIPLLEQLAADSVKDVRVTLRELNISPLDMEGELTPEGSDYTEEVTDSEYTGSGSEEYTEGSENQDQT